MELFKTVHDYLFLFLQILRFRPRVHKTHLKNCQDDIFKIRLISPKFRVKLYKIRSNQKKNVFV